ncbi:O-Antigen ligase [Pirellulimonas nuda]|uniref:O-Antigen ligase n=1 Tax=Pirellulimonas nuda TaxID=2528009 RepID=A0A518D7L8_9BACT|nr:O-antigen ligase family protein [Pirellulimonas nuda]QDU87445.1 O-Antigen ligase [Pirellulimonas nuda]
MPIALALIAVAALLLAAAFARRASLLSMAAIVLVVGYVFGHSFWHANLGPIPLTLDRLLLMGLVALLAWRWKRGELSPAPLAGADWALAACLACLSISFLLNRPGEFVPQPTSILWRLIVAFWAPAALYLVARQAPLGPREVRVFFAILAGLGVYLAFTGLAETAGAWAVVFPRYIADPEQGLHFGRARGPELNSVSMGAYLGICLWATWMLVPKASRLMQLLLVGACGAMALVVLLTYTRSTWLGLGLSGLVVAGLQTPRRLRAPMLGIACLAGGVLLVAAWDKIIGLEREDSGSVSAHSVQQREAFVYVSMNMFRDNPLWGVGFGRFYDRKLPYLSDRSQSFELESIRGLHHHNTYLGLLTETGLLGLASYAALLGGIGVCGWRLATAPEAEPELRALGQFALAALAIYSVNAALHDITHIHPDQWLLMTIAGAAVGAERRLMARRAVGVQQSAFSGQLRDAPAAC